MSTEARYANTGILKNPSDDGLIMSFLNNKQQYVTFRNWLKGFVLALSLVCASMANAAEQIIYYHFDALGSPVAASDATGNYYLWKETYQPYGARIQKQPNSVNNTRWYTGKPQDDETGLSYFGARYYDSVIGRFMGVDPKEFSERSPHSFNRYNYANNNPYAYIDPDGKEVVKIAFTQTYMYIGSGGVAFTSSQALAQQHPGLNQLTPAMQEAGRRVLFEMEGRGWQPAFVEPPLRTPEQQAEKVHSGVSQTTNSKHLDQGGQGSGAMDIIDKRWGQVDNTKERQRFFKELGETGKNEGLRWGGDYKPISPRTGYGWDPAHLEKR